MSSYIRSSKMCDDRDDDCKSRDKATRHVTCNALTRSFQVFHQNNSKNNVKGDDERRHIYRADALIPGIATKPFRR